MADPEKLGFEELPPLPPSRDTGSIPTSALLEPQSTPSRGSDSLEPKEDSSTTRKGTSDQEKHRNLTVENEDIRQNELFVQVEKDYTVTLDSLLMDNALDKFRIEYEKLYRAVVRSRTRRQKIFLQYRELYAEWSSNHINYQNAYKLTIQDEEVIKKLKEQIQFYENKVYESNRKEESSKEQLRQLRGEIANLSNTLKQGVGLSSAQEKIVSELVQAKEASLRELEIEMNSIMQYRNEISQVMEKIRVDDAEKRSLEQQIYELKDRHAQKKADVDAELRQKDLLERELRDVRGVVALSAQEVRQKQEIHTRAIDDIAILESQTKSQKQLMEKLSNDFENTNNRIVKFQQDYEEQIAETSELVDINLHLSKELRKKENSVVKHKNEVRKIAKVREMLAAKNKSLDEQRADIELQRKTIRHFNENCMNENDQLKREIEIDKKTMDDLNRERDILRHNLQKVMTESQKYAHMKILFEQIRHNIQQEITRYTNETAKYQKVAKQLKVEKDGYVKEMVRLQALCVKELQAIKQSEMQIFDLKRKTGNAETKLKHQQNLYDAVQSDRNLHSKHLLNSQNEIAEMKRKLKTMNYQINGFKDEILIKEQALATEIQENQRLGKDIELINDEIKTLKTQNELAQAYIRSQIVEELKLNQAVKDAEAEKSRQENSLSMLVSERDNLFSQIMKQNIDLNKVYETIKTQQNTLLHCEKMYHGKFMEVTQAHNSMVSIKHDLMLLKENNKNARNMEHTISQLHNEILREQTRIKALEEELKNPVNVHRWRHLEGSDPKTFELIQLLQSLQRKLISKTREEYQKSDMILEKDRIYLTLKNNAAKLVGPEVAEQLREFDMILKDKNAQLKHMAKELAMYQAQVEEYKHAIAGLDLAMAEVRRKYFLRRKREKANTTLLPENAPIKQNLKSIQQPLEISQ
jgi:chromosome segregation ATPase